MTQPVTMLPTQTRDQQALDAATRAGRVVVSSPDSQGEMSPERATFLSLSIHLARVTARVANFSGGAHTIVSFVDVLYEWPHSWEGSQYPRGIVDSMSCTQYDALVQAPIQVANPITGTTDDLISDDGKWALWLVGEDVGEGIVAVFGQYQAHAHALAEAVRNSLQGDFDVAQGAWLPLPEAYISPPFRTQMGIADFPLARVSVASGGEAQDQAAEPDGNAWRRDVRFRWQAPRFAARARIPDLSTINAVRVGPPGQEIRL